MKNIFAIIYMLVATVEIYGTDWCPYCKRAESLLTNNGIKYEKHYFKDRLEMNKFYAEKNIRSIPQIYINGKNIGGYDSLKKLEENGQLSKLIR